ncbi:hypothetical protein [Hydrogenophaga sp.]|uniref:hypothetical protein n=1 Tax=Hydrogenophaga sp. TaxID=1904254 RepID=UPI00271F2A48|nr:hypothetical protein [Hydrogenophaga sp.]MDO9437907.1 hypothetical protein [Hydrogenophaga sp.]
MTQPSFVIRGGAHPHVRDVPGAWGAYTLGYEVLKANDIFSAMLKTRPYEICEFSLANFLTLRAHGDDGLQALPIFPQRAFRHGTLTVRRDSELLDPAQLAGARIGVEDYSMSAAVWVRGLLWDEHGVDHADITWVTPHDQRFAPPTGVKLEHDDRSLEALLAEGAVDAIVGMHLKDSELAASQRQFRSLLPDPPATEATYFQRTGIFPINHCVVIRTDVLRAHPDLGDVVANAYRQAKTNAYRQQSDPRRAPWAECAPHRAFEAADGDPLAYGLTASNRRVVETLGGYLERQGFIRRLPPLDGLFLSPSTSEAL